MEHLLDYTFFDFAHLFKKCPEPMTEIFVRIAAAALDAVFVRIHLDVTFQRLFGLSIALVRYGQMADHYIGILAMI